MRNPIENITRLQAHYAIIDQKIVWYGSMNLLANSKIDDSMMRVESAKVALELMGLTFGKEKQKDGNNGT